MANEKLISTDALIAKFEEAIADQYGYIYGATHEWWTKEKQSSYAKKYADNADRKMSCKYGGKWAGHYVTDCSGLFAWAFKELGGSIYHGSNTMYLSYCTAKGDLKAGKRTDGKPLLPGTAVFTYNSSTGKRGHVGLFIGNGTVIEAKGAQYGVIKSQVTDSRWVNWGELKGVSYSGAKPDPEPKPEPGYAIVTGKKVALRQDPSTRATIIMRINTGETVKLEPEPDLWDYVSYNGKKGWMMKEFLNEG